MFGQDPFSADMDELDDMELDLEGLGARRFKKFPKRRSKWEWLDWPYWDTVQMPIAGSTSLEFFKVPYGGTKTRAETNLGVAGQITDGSAYWIQAICFAVNYRQATIIPEAEARELIWDGYLELAINNTNYFACPLSKLNWGGGSILSDQSGGLGTDAYLNNLPTHQAIYPLRKIIVIPKNVTFEITLYWRVAPTPTANEYLNVCLEGLLARAKRR